MIKLDHVSKLYDDQQVLAPTDLFIERERCFVLIGPSGCGKSTLLRLIMGLIEPTTGSVWFQEEQVTSESVLRLRHRMGYVIQEGGLFPHKTAGENVSLMATHLGWSRNKIETRLTELSELTHLPLELLDRYPAQLSGGQRQRVSLMRALMLDPELLLLDEPLGALDPMIRADLQTDLKAICRSLKKTVVLVTHDLAEAAFFADEIILLKEGTIVQNGTLTDLQTEPADAFVTRFIQAQRQMHEIV